MIVEMKHLDLICVAAARESTLEALRSLGAVHLDFSQASGESLLAAQEELARASKAVQLIAKARKMADEGPVRSRSVAEVLALEEDREKLETAAEALRSEIRQYEAYGDFDPHLAKRLATVGLELRLGEEGQWDIVAVGDTEASPVVCALPEKSLRWMREKLSRLENRCNIDIAKLASSDEGFILKQYPDLADRIGFESARSVMASAGELAVIAGWLPVSRVDEVRAKAHSCGWGLLLRAPEPGERPPTLIQPPRLFRPMLALLNGLGILPDYTEADVSVPFLGYFSIFFAMLVGDGAYGLLFLGGTLWGWRGYARRKHSLSPVKAELLRSWLILLTIFSVATVGWGLLSNTWFGAALPWCASWPTVRWLADPSYHHMMLLCFTIGVSHLMLARIWNGLCRLNDSTAIAQFGWAGILLFMYFVTNTIVGIFPSIPQWLYVVFGLSLVAVFGFTVKPSELRVRGAELGMLPLNIMSALGDVISYVRLFAVGLASLKVAENFNAMATGLLSASNEFWVQVLLAVAMVAILLVGHALNLAMAGLSVLVHAVRLNTLEFSNHKGVSWAGYAFRAFRRTARDKD